MTPRSAYVAEQMQKERWSLMRFLAAFVCLFRFSLAAVPEPSVQVPILVYHRVGQTVTDGMTIDSK